MRIVVCEDDPLILMNIAEMLHELGHRAEEALDGASALLALANGEIDMLITDIGLPDMNGIELAARAREIDAALPIIFSSGLGLANELAGHPRMAALNKPYSLQGLEAAIDAVSGHD